MKFTWNIYHSLISKVRRKSVEHAEEQHLKECVDVNNNNVEKDLIEDKYMLSTISWYWPELSGVPAERILYKEADGTFLVRKSSTPGYMFTVTYKIEGKVGNLRVQCRNGLFCLSFHDPLQPREPTLKGLIEKLYQLTTKESFICGLKRELNGVTTSVPLKLERPLKRNITLQDHCRKAIMRRMNDPQDVLQLDLTTNMKQFLLELKDEV